MKKDHPHHLTEDQIVAAVVAENDLPAHLQAHLSFCRECSIKKDSFSQDLFHLGQKAVEMAPAISGRIRLPEKKRVFIFNRHFKNALAVCAASIFIFLTVWNFDWESKPDFQEAQIEQQDTAIFMAEIKGLVENALPREYQDIAGTADFGFQVDFMQYIVPGSESLYKKSDENQNEKTDNHKKGVS